MQRDARAYRNTLIAVWAVFLAVAVIYSIQQHSPMRVVVPFAAAAMVEIALYLVPGFAWSRALIESLEPLAARALAIQLSSLVPYLVYSLGTGTFHWRSLVLLAALTAVASAWYVLMGKNHFVADALFLILVGTVILAKVFPRIYIELAPRITAGILGQLMWIRVTILSVLSIRGISGINFGFLPTGRDWRIGTQQFLLFAPLAIVLGMLLRFMQPHVAAGAWWKVAAIAAATFAGVLWVVALSEEFFCRGMLQQMLAKKFGSTAAGVIAASVVFGLLHLPFRHFPNWKFAVLAAVAGVFYGLAYVRAGSIRASMVTHAYVVTMWRVFFA